MQLKQVNELTKEERLLLKETEDEYKRRGAFKRVFPSLDFPYYKQFFEEVRPMNYFLDAQIMSKYRLSNPMQARNDEKAPRFLQREYLSTTNTADAKEPLKTNPIPVPSNRLNNQLTKIIQDK